MRALELSVIAMPVIKAILVCFLSVACLMPVAADSHTWKGASGAKFNVASNWSPATVPAEGDELVFNTAGTFQNDITAGRTFKKITFSGSVNVTLTGNSFKLGAGGIVCTTTSSSYTSTIENNFVISFTETPLACTGSGYKCGNLALKGVISGVGGFYKTGSGSLLLYGNNTFTGRLVALGNGYRNDGTTGFSCVHLYSSTGLGLSDEARFGFDLDNLPQTRKAVALIVHGQKSDTPIQITTPERIYIEGTDDAYNRYAARLDFQEGDVDFYPAVQFVGGWGRLYSRNVSGRRAKYRLYGDVTADSVMISSPESNCELHYVGAVMTEGYWYWYGYNNYLHSTRNYATTYLRLVEFAVHCASNNVLPCSSKNYLQFERTSNKNYNWVYLDGHDQRQRKNPSEVNMIAENDYGFSSETPAVMWWEGSNGVQNCGFHGQFKGAAGLGWDVAIPRGTFVYSNTVSTTTGKLVVSNGWAHTQSDPFTERGKYSAIRLSNGASFTALSKIELHPNRVLAVDDGSGSGLYCDEFWSNYGGLILDGAVQVVCRKAIINDRNTCGFTNLPTGVYSFSEFPDTIAAEDTGGTLRVLPQNWELTKYEWTGAAGDKLLTTPGNWKGNVAPNFEDGSAQLVFNGGTDEAIVDGRLEVHDITFSSNANFTLMGKVSSETGESPTLVFNGGIISCANTGSRAITYKIADSVALEFSVSPVGNWNIPKNTTLSIAGPMSAPASSAYVRFLGEGTVDLSGDNSEFYAPFYVGNYMVRSGARRALGSPSRAVYVYADNCGGNCSSGGYKSLGFLKLYGAGLTCDTPLTFEVVNHGSDKGWNAVSGWILAWIADNTTDHVVLNGLMTSTSSGDFYPRYYNIDFYGGISVGHFWPHPAGNPTHWIMNEPFVARNPSPYDFVVTGSATYHWGSPNNVHSWLKVYKAATLIFEAPNVIATNATVQTFENSDNNTFIDLNGHNQTCFKLTNGFAVAQSTTSYSIIKSTQPASLRVVGMKDLLTPHAIQFQGQAGLTYAAGAETAELRLCNQLSDTKGTLTVESGILSLYWGAGFPNISAVNVLGGTLRVSENSAPKAFGSAQGLSAAVMHVATDAKLNLEGGMTTVKTLKVGTEFIPSGIYGKRGSTKVGLAFQLDCITGDGLLKVNASDKPGTVIIFY